MTLNNYFSTVMDAHCLNFNIKQSAGGLKSIVTYNGFEKAKIFIYFSPRPAIVPPAIVINSN